jgi:hypothetical protein
MHHHGTTDDGRSVDGGRRRQRPTTDHNNQLTSTTTASTASTTTTRIVGRPRPPLLCPSLFSPMTTQLEKAPTVLPVATAQPVRVLEQQRGGTWSMHLYYFPRIMIHRRPIVMTTIQRVSKLQLRDCGTNLLSLGVKAKMMKKKTSLAMVTTMKYIQEWDLTVTKRRPKRIRLVNITSPMTCVKRDPFLVGMWTNSRWRPSPQGEDVLTLRMRKHNSPISHYCSHNYTEKGFG